MHEESEGNVIVIFFLQAFLSRLPSSPTGFVSWAMDFSTSGLVIDTITIITHCVTMESGKVDWKLEGDDDVVENLSFSSQRGMCYLLSNSENHEHLRYMYGWNVHFVLYVTAVSYYILEICQSRIL